MEIDFTYNDDDSCAVQLYSRGHADDAVSFIAECEKFMAREFEENCDLKNIPIKKTYWRNVKAPEDCIVHDRQLVESTKGPGAFEVTILDTWLDT